MTAVSRDVLDDLRAKADAATDGPWHPATTGIESGDHWSVVEYPVMGMVAHIPSQDGGNEVERRADAEFIAAANPERVRELLDRIDALEATIARVRELADEARMADGDDPVGWVNTGASDDYEEPSTAHADALTPTKEK